MICKCQCKSHVNEIHVPMLVSCHRNVRAKTNAMLMKYQCQCHGIEMKMLNRKSCQWNPCPILMSCQCNGNASVNDMSMKWKCLCKWHVNEMEIPIPCQWHVNVNAKVMSKKSMSQCSFEVNELSVLIKMSCNEM